MRLAWRILGAVAGAALAFTGCTGQALAADDDEEEEHWIVWDDRRPRVSVAEHVLAGLSLAGSLTIEFGTNQPDHPVWKKRNVFDRGVREAFVARNRDDRDRVATASDILEIFAAGYPVIVDTALVVLAGDRNLDIFEQMMAMNGEAYGLTYLFSRTFHRLLPRERPAEIGCREDPEWADECGRLGDTASFVGGHVGVAAVGAGVTCAHHAYLPVYGGGAPDVIACAGLTSVALAVGVLRIVADRHWATDIMAGFGIGFSLGLGLPILLHYDREVPDDTPATTSVAPQALRPSASPTVFSWGGTF